MPWLSPFILGRPGQEIEFDINPMAMTIQEQPVIVLQRNLAGDLKKSLMKRSAPAIQINANYLTKAQRDQFASLVGIADSFLSFQTRDDWQVVDELAQVLTSTTVKIGNSSATRLSSLLVSLGLPSQITISTPFDLLAGGGVGFGLGGFGEGGFGSWPETFDPGTITYDDATRVISFTNPLSDLTQPVFVTYTYKGWLVHMDVLGHTMQAGWLDRFQYSFQLIGA